MKPISIKKTLNNEKEKFEVRFEFVPKDEKFDFNRLEKLLDDFINNHKHDYMIKNVTIIRTMLEDCEEKLLVISYEDEKGSEFVKFINSNLYLYESSKLEENNKYDNRYKIKYEPFSGIKLDYNNHKFDVTDHLDFELASKEIKEMLQQIYCLMNVKAIKLNREEKLLIEIYKLFYNENPDFLNKEINIKIQTMLFILSSFGVSLGDNYNFSLYKDEKAPFSINLAILINKLYPFGEVENIKDNVKLNKEIEKIIKIVGQCIRDVISSEEDLNNALAVISKILYAKMYCLSSSADANRISEFTECTTEEVESSIKLVKKIKNKIENEIK